MTLYYYTGKGTLLDKVFAGSLQLVQDELVEVVSIVNVPHTLIEYFLVKKINGKTLISNDSVRPFTSRAIKPFTSPEENAK